MAQPQIMEYNDFMSALKDAEPHERVMIVAVYQILEQIAYLTEVIDHWPKGE